MLPTLLLDALSAIGEAEAMFFFGKLFLLVVVPIALLLYFWSRHIGEQFDREPKQAKPSKQVQGAHVFLWIMIAVMVVSFLALSGWML